LSKAKAKSLLAAKLNHVEAMSQFGLSLDDSDPQRWQWWCRAATNGLSCSLLSSFAPFVDRFSSDPSLGPAVFRIGRALKGRINTEKRDIFGDSYNFDSRIGPANRAVSFFFSQCSAARAAVDTWCLIARRVGNNLLNKDVRKKVGMLIWEAREQADYKAIDRKLMNHALDYCVVQ